jgi:hemerythrin-like domain-containing protein
MADTLALWHADHVNFAWLLTLLERQLALFHDDGSPDYDLMLDIMYYMTHYSDVVHHPKEDLVFAMVKERDKGAAHKVDDLARQHARLKAAGDSLVEALDGIVAGTIASRAQVEGMARDYVTQLRSHMRTEEREILPLAARLLNHDDWSAVDAAIAHIADPLFGSSAEQRYAALREQIAREARIPR